MSIDRARLSLVLFLFKFSKKKSIIFKKKNARHEDVNDRVSASRLRIINCNMQRSSYIQSPGQPNTALQVNFSLLDVYNGSRFMRAAASFFFGLYNYILILYGYVYLCINI